MKFLVLACLVAAAYGLAPPKPQFAMDWDRSGKVIGGTDADITEFPYQVAMLYGFTSFSQSCGGSIFRADVIICAAHCPAGSSASNWRVRAGSTQSASGGQLMTVARTLMHPQYASSTIDYDISLYFLDEAINLGATAAPIPLPAQDAPVTDGAISWVTGWGSIREGGGTVANLQKVEVPVVNQQACANAYAGVNPITTRMICAGVLGEGGKDACQGDSGGPLAVDGVLIGITSWGVGCGRAQYPGVWARVPFFVNWINDNTA